MAKKNIQKDLELIDAVLKDKGISRRDAIKMLGFGSAVLATGSTSANAATNANASDAKGKVVIIGGGLAGMSTAARLASELSNPDITVIEPNPHSPSYQPGQTLVAAGIWESDDISYERDEFLPDDVKLIKESVKEINADNNFVVTDKGTKVSYDFLVVAAGVKLNYGAIKGLEEAGEAYSTGDNSKVQDVLDSVGASSLYIATGAIKTWENMQKIIASAKAGKDLKAVFTHPNTPIKCGGAPKKIMYLMNSRLVEENVRSKVDMHFYPNGGGMFGIKDYHTAIVEQFKERDFKWSYKHNLVEVKNGKAIFDNHNTTKGKYDEDLEIYENVTTHKRVEVDFDFLHITPPMKAPDEIANSDVGSKLGWVLVDKETLQHAKYKNVFSLGDIAGVPMGKTGGSVRKQYKVLVSNLISAMSGERLEARYDGYTVCPLITDIGSVMLAEFNWASKKTGSGANAAAISFLDPTQERYIWWLLKVYLLKPMTMYGMYAGRA